MASTSRQKRGVCGHVMASVDQHDWYARCREKVVGSNTCVLGEEPCKLAIPKYNIRKEKKAEGKRDTELIDPQDISVIKAVLPLRIVPLLHR